MHGLHEIHRANERAFTRAILSARKDGPVVVVYQGLHIARYEACADDTAANQAAERIKRADGPISRCEILPQLSEAEAKELVGRDQSEDRQPAAT